MKLFSFDDLEEGFRYPESLIASGQVLQNFTRKEVGHYLTVTIPLPFKCWFCRFSCNKSVYARAYFRFIWVTDFLPCMEYPEDRIDCFVAPLDD